MADVVSLLRQTSKGKLIYNRDIDEKELLKSCTSSPQISAFHEESPKSIKSVCFGLVPSDENAVTEEKGCKDSHEIEAKGFEDWYDIEAERQQNSFQNNGQNFHQNDCSTNSTVNGSSDVSGSKLQIDDQLEQQTTKFNSSVRIIADVEKHWDNKTEERLKRKQEEFQHHEYQLEKKQQMWFDAVSKWCQQTVENQRNIFEIDHCARKEEINRNIQKLRESHSECSLRQHAKFKELKKLSQILQEEKAKREEELEQKLTEVRSLARDISLTKSTMLNTLENCPFKNFLSDAAEKTKLLAHKLAEHAEMLITRIDNLGTLDDVLQKLKQLREQSQNANDYVHTLTADAETKAKAAAEAEKQKQQQQQQQIQSNQQQESQQRVSGGITPGKNMQAATGMVDISPGEVEALRAVAKIYENNMDILAKVDEALKSFITNEQMKKYRYDLKRAVNNQVNTISEKDRSLLFSKLQQLGPLLQGQSVSLAGSSKRVCAKDAPEGILFCKNLVARMIALRAEELVTSDHKASFAIAVVAVGLWAEFPNVGELLMVHLQQLCPYVLPFYPPRLPQQSSTEYHRSMGYKVDENGTIEQQDKFLKRMSGIMRLYAAIIITQPPPSIHKPHPHGLEHAWIWLCRVLNIAPSPDITAQVIYDMLVVTGNALLRTYRVQFVKLLYFLMKNYLPKLKAVAATSLPVFRLESFLETTMKNSAQVPLPDGYISADYWCS